MDLYLYLWLLGRGPRLLALLAMLLGLRLPALLLLLVLLFPLFRIPLRRSPVLDRSGLGSKIAWWMDPGAWWKMGRRAMEDTLIGRRAWWKRIPALDRPPRHALPVRIALAGFLSTSRMLVRIAHTGHLGMAWPPLAPRTWIHHHVGRLAPIPGLRSRRGGWGPTATRCYARRAAMMLC